MVRIAAIGDNDVDCYLSTGQMYPGGNCFNVAIMASRLGAEAAYIGAVGRDAAGALMRDTLVLENVSIERLRIEDGKTAYCIIDHKDSDRIFVSYDLGVSHFTPSEQDIAWLSRFDAAHIGHTSGLDQWMPEFAKKTRISYDFSTRATDELIAAMSPHIWLATVSAGDLQETEAQALINKIQNAGADWVLATRGSQGAVLCHGTQRWEAQPVKVETVDTLGAGDTMITRVLIGLLQGEDPQSAMENAAKAAAETCTYYGAVGHGSKIDVPDALPILERMRA
ncbi:PfkB family carbohydrate kinase [Pseudochrobactrum sp. MP213Fo]|uniref:PfkB family carbohydrate kinase n=1 Tax=Pseudochrobactrum sp. MP213Fo TaxID=3022250 RepID=UPI003B9DD4CC